jgi:hypothetical protein
LAEGASVNLGREAIAWSADSWQRLDQAVLHEMHRASVAAAILPLVGPYPDAQTVPADAIASDRLTVDEGAVLPLVELSVELSLTTTQIAAGGDQRADFAAFDFIERTGTARAGVGICHGRSRGLGTGDSGVESIGDGEHKRATLTLAEVVAQFPQLFLAALVVQRGL